MFWLSAFVAERLHNSRARQQRSVGFGGAIDTTRAVAILGDLGCPASIDMIGNVGRLTVAVIRAAAAR